MKKIPLSQGKFALVDDDDFEWLNQWNWFADNAGKTWYARTNVKRDGKSTVVPMHRMIMNMPEGVKIDHRNRNGLDNQRKNLRLCSDSQNQSNRGTNKNSKTGLKGVFPHKCGKYLAQIMVNRKRIYLGLFSDAKEAARVYDEAAKELHGEFAFLNFP